MKNKKLFLPIVILAASVFLIIVYSIVSSIAKKPTVTKAEFPFTIIYELNGETVTISDVYKVNYVRNDGYSDTKSRVYVGEIGNMGEDNTVYTLKKDSQGRIELYTNFYPDYMMGDSEYDYFDGASFEPQIFYYDTEETEYGDEETLSSHGVKLVSFEYPTPIENSFVFSHISYFSASVVFPTLLIALLALIAIIVFIKKEVQYKPIDKISIVLSFVIGFTVLPFVTIVAMLIDAQGGGPEFYYQMLYFIPPFLVLCISCSLVFRRKGDSIKSLIAELVGPGAFAIYLLICGILGLL